MLRKKKFKFTLYKFGSLGTVAALPVSKVLNIFVGYSTFNNIYYRIVDVIISVILVEIAIIV